MPEWLLLFYVQQTFTCMGTGLNGDVDMAWMMVQASPIFLTDVNIIWDIVLYQSGV